jgi:hypothetical protein
MPRSRTLLLAAAVGAVLSVATFGVLAWASTFGVSSVTGVAGGVLRWLLIGTAACLVAGVVQGRRRVVVFPEGRTPTDRVDQMTAAVEHASRSGDVAAALVGVGCRHDEIDEDDVVAQTAGVREVLVTAVVDDLTGRDLAVFLLDWGWDVRAWSPLRSSS